MVLPIATTLLSTKKRKAVLVILESVNSVFVVYATGFWGSGKADRKNRGELLDEKADMFLTCSLFNTNSKHRMKKSLL